VGGMEGSSEDGICYICMDGDAGPSRCACTDRLVHEKCLIHWLRQQSKTHCDVCLVEYDNVIRKVSYKRKPAEACWAVLMMSFCSPVLATCGVLLLYLYSSPSFDSSGETLAKGIALLAGSVCGFSVCFWWAGRFRREGWRLWDTKQNSEVVFTEPARASPPSPSKGDGAQAVYDEE
jgi:hypothetical protein